MNRPIDTAHLMNTLKSRKKGEMTVNITLNESDVQFNSNVSFLNACRVTILLHRGRTQ